MSIDSSWVRNQVNKIRAEIHIVPPKEKPARKYEAIVHHTDDLPYNRTLDEYYKQQEDVKPPATQQVESKFIGKLDDNDMQDIMCKYTVNDKRRRKN